MKNLKGRQEQGQNWILYLDEKKNTVGAIVDDHLGVDKMIKSKPGWKLLGYYYGCMDSAIKYAKEVFLQ
jgi:hypothetical protein